MLNKFSITLISLLFLQSCGSGSSSDSSTPVIKEYQFQLEAHLTNSCGQKIAFDRYEVHLQDDDWQLIEKYNADVNGQVNFTSRQEDINYTIIAKSQKEQSAEGLDIVSYYQANAATSASYEATYDNLKDNTNCECITQDITIQHRAFSIVDSISTSFNYEGEYDTNSRSTNLTNVEVCRKVNDAWPVQSVSIRGVDDNNKAIGVASIIEDFSTNAENEWQVAAIEVADTVDLPQDSIAFQMAQTFMNGEHFQTNTEDNDEEVLIFNTHPYISESIYHTEASHIFEDLDTIFGQSTFTSHHQVKSTMYGAAFDVLAETTRPNIDNSSFSSLTGDGIYDYSNVFGYPMVQIIFNYQVNTPVPVTWTMYGPRKGVLASSVQLTGYEDVINLDTSIQSTNIKIIKSLNSSKYEEYIRYYQGVKNTEFEDNLHYFQLKLQL